LLRHFRQIVSRSAGTIAPRRDGGTGSSATTLSSTTCCGPSNGGRLVRPYYGSRRVAAPGETWGAIDAALKKGWRGLPGGDSLARLLARERGACNSRNRLRLTAEQILAWGVAHRRRTGEWPGVLSGPIPEAPGEDWRAVNLALYKGHRGLPGADSLARLQRRNGRR
jgi:hypothetical protein